MKLVHDMKMGEAQETINQLSNENEELVAKIKVLEEEESKRATPVRQVEPTEAEVEARSIKELQAKHK